MSIYYDKLAHIQVVINCWYSVAQMCTREDMLAQYLGEPYLDDVISHKRAYTSCHITWKHFGIEVVFPP